MAKQRPKNEQQPEWRNNGITRTTVGGFKSIAEEQNIEIRPLTILAGANSSGKSSIMQPLLLLKQTLDATYDPGSLLLNGPNVQFTQIDQMLSQRINTKASDRFRVGLDIGSEVSVGTTFVRSKNIGKGFDVEETVYGFDTEKYRLYVGMTKKELQNIFVRINNFRAEKDIKPDLVTLPNVNISLSDINLSRNRCFFTFAVKLQLNSVEIPSANFPLPNESLLEEHIRQVIHLPGLRGNPERTYPVTAVGNEFPGTFERYVASVIGQWQTERNSKELERMIVDLGRLGLTRSVIAEPINDAQVELLVIPYGYTGDIDGTEDLISIADVGLGVSQTLPVIVALYAAEPEQLIYLEQPEIHLHPRAQSAMAEVLADAALQGKRLVVETHSSLLLLGIQTLVAEGKLPPELVKLHWFTSQEDGSTKITSADLDETGAFGDWPEDFATVTLESEDRYLDAAQKSLKGK